MCYFFLRENSYSSPIHHVVCTLSVGEQVLYLSALSYVPSPINYFKIQRDVFQRLMLLELNSQLFCAVPRIQWTRLLQHPCQILPWLLSKGPRGHPCCSSCRGFRNKPPSDAVPPSPREDCPLMKAMSQKPRGVNVLPCLHDAAVIYSRAVAMPLLTLPVFAAPSVQGRPLSAPHVPRLPVVHWPLWHAVPRSSLSKEWVSLHFVFTLCFHT